MRALLALGALAMTTAALADSDVTEEKAVATSSFPTEWEGVDDARVVALPEIPEITSANTFNITAYGAKRTSKNNTTAIQAALDAVPDEGGMVVIPAGEWLCGPIEVKSKTVLHLAKGATLKLLPFGGYKVTVAEGEEYYPTTDGATYSNFIRGKGNNSVTDIIIEGESRTYSVIDGQGAPWWKSVEDNNKQPGTRPALIRFEKGARFLFRNMRLQNSPGTNLTLGRSGNAKDFTVHDITIKNPASTLGAGKASHNTDGIPMWGPYINIYNCNIDTGDDNIVTDSNACFVHAWNLNMGAGHGASMGSYTTNMHHIIFEKMTFNGTETALRVKTNRDRSGDVYGIIYRNIVIKDCTECPIFITCDYDNFTTPSEMATSEVISTTPKFHDFLFQDITGNCTYGANSKANKRGNSIFVYGRPESYVKNVTFDNVKISANNGMLLAYCEGIEFKNGCQITNVADASKTFSAQYEATYSGEYNDASAVSPTGTATIDQTTYKNSSEDTYTWNFSNGFSISNSASKAYAKGQGSKIKFSATEYTVTIPDGIAVTGIKFDGYGNADDDAYIKSVNGVSYETTDYVFAKRESDGNGGYTYTSSSYDIELASAATGTMKFAIGNKQIGATITLATASTSGETDNTPTGCDSDAIEPDEEAPEIPEDDTTAIKEIKKATDESSAIYNLAGKVVSGNAKGILIRKGRAFLKK